MDKVKNAIFALLLVLSGIFVLVCTFCWRKEPVERATKPAPPVTRPALDEAEKRFTKTYEPEPAATASTAPVKRSPPKGYPGPAKRVPLRLSLLEAPAPTAAEAPTIVKVWVTGFEPAYEGSRFKVGCNCVDKSCLAEAECRVTTGACGVELKLTGSPPTPCRWGSDTDGWVAFTWGQVTIDDGPKRRAVGSR